MECWGVSFFRLKRPSLPKFTFGTQKGIVLVSFSAQSRRWVFLGNFDWSTLGRSEQCFNTVGMNLLVAVFCSAETACFLAVPHQESMDLGSQFWIQCKARLTSFTHRVRLFPWSNACPYSPTGMNTFLALQLALAPTNGDCCTSSSFWATGCGLACHCGLGWYVFYALDVLCGTRNYTPTCYRIVTFCLGTMNVLYSRYLVWHQKLQPNTLVKSAFRLGGVHLFTLLTFVWQKKLHPEMPWILALRLGRVNFFHTVDILCDTGICRFVNWARHLND